MRRSHLWSLPIEGVFTSLFFFVQKQNFYTGELHAVSLGHIHDFDSDSNAVDYCSPVALLSIAPIPLKI